MEEFQLTSTGYDPRHELRGFNMAQYVANQDASNLLIELRHEHAIKIAEKILGHTIAAVPINSRVLPDTVTP